MQARVGATALRWHVTVWDLWFLLWGVLPLVSGLGHRPLSGQGTLAELRVDQLPLFRLETATETPLALRDFQWHADHREPAPWPWQGPQRVSR
jgi:hypothetical protein